MNRIELFKQHILEKRAVKVVTGMDNFDIESVKKIVSSANIAGASAIDICANEEIILAVKEISNLPIIASSIIPSELVKAVELGVDGIELGNYEAFYKKGMAFSANEIMSLVKETLSLLGEKRVFFSVTIPGEISIVEQIELARNLEYMGIDLIQTEGHHSEKAIYTGVRGLMHKAELTLSNTIELSRNIDAPIMASCGINPATAPFAFVAGASAIGVCSCVNKLNTELSMIATIKSIVEIANKNKQEILELV